MPDKIPYDELSLIKLERIHNRPLFACIDADLTEFFIEDSIMYQERNAAVTYICIYRESIVGFVTIATCSVSVKLDERKEIDQDLKELSEFPGIRIARLATHKDYERRGVGEYMIKKIAKMALDISSQIGIRLIIVDSKPHVVGWYERFGFKKLEKYKNRQNPVMYIDLLKAFYA